MASTINQITVIQREKPKNHPIGQDNKLVLVSIPSCQTWLTAPVNESIKKI
jgi:hypothetical protein